VTANVFRQLLNKSKAAHITRSCDYRNLMLLLPFELSNLFRDEVEEHNRRRSGRPVVDPSEELIGVANVSLNWYKLLRQTTTAKAPADISRLRSLSLRYMLGFCMNFMTSDSDVTTCLPYPQVEATSMLTGHSRQSRY
jgi:hypothetical protein